MATVLVIEDDPPTRKLIRAIVEDRGDYDVWEASDGEEGVMLCRLLLPDLVITDIMMPVQGGIETIVDLQAIFYGVKVIAMSSHTDKLELALRLGAKNVFQKPFSPQEFGEAVKEAMQNTSPRSA